MNTICILSTCMSKWFCRLWGLDLSPVPLLFKCFWYLSIYDMEQKTALQLFFSTMQTVQLATVAEGESDVYFFTL